MTNDRAVEILKAIIYMLGREYDTDEVEEAIHMAITALEAQESCNELATNLQPCKQDVDDMISKLSEIRSEYNCFDEAERSYYHALFEAIKVLSGRADGDTISRQDAIDALCKAGCNSGYCGVSCDDVRAIEALPPASPEIVRRTDGTN